MTTSLKRLLLMNVSSSVIFNYMGIFMRVSALCAGVTFVLLSWVHLEPKLLDVLFPTPVILVFSNILTTIGLSSSLPSGARVTYFNGWVFKAVMIFSFSSALLIPYFSSKSDATMKQLS